MAEDHLGQHKRKVKIENDARKCSKIYNIILTEHDLKRQEIFIFFIYRRRK